MGGNRWWEKIIGLAELTLVSEGWSWSSRYTCSLPPQITRPNPPTLRCNLWRSGWLKILGTLKYEEHWRARLSRVICGGREQVYREDQDHPSLTKVSSANPIILPSSDTIGIFSTLKAIDITFSRSSMTEDMYDSAQVDKSQTHAKNAQNCKNCHKKLSKNDRF